MNFDLDRVSRILFDEAQLLDDREFRKWVDLFLPDAYYWVPSHPQQRERRGQLSIIDEGIAEMLLRVERLSQPTAHTENPVMRSCRVVTNIRIEKSTPGGFEVRSKLVMHDYRVCEFAKDEARVFCGTQRHALLEGEGGFQIAWKRFDMISADAAMPVLSPPF